MSVFILNKEHEHALESLLVAEESGPEQANGAECTHTEPIGEKVASTLETMHYVERQGDRLVLTPEGREMAEGFVRRHRLTEVLLDSVLGLDRKRAFDIGCHMEHEMPPEMAEAFCILLGHPTTCPHGLPIPPGPCCEAHQTTVETQVVPLTDLRPGEKGRVMFIKPKNHHRLHRLTSLGLTPGVVVELHQRSPAVCFRFEGTELAMEKDVADDIYVARISG